MSDLDPNTEKNVGSTSLGEDYTRYRQQTKQGASDSWAREWLSGASGSQAAPSGGSSSSAAVPAETAGDVETPTDVAVTSQIATTGRGPRKPNLPAKTEEPKPTQFADQVKAINTPNEALGITDEPFMGANYDKDMFNLRKKIGDLNPGIPAPVIHIGEAFAAPFKSPDLFPAPQGREPIMTLTNAAVSNLIKLVEGGSEAAFQTAAELLAAIPNMDPDVAPEKYGQGKRDPVAIANALKEYASGFAPGELVVFPMAGRAAYEASAAALPGEAAPAVSAASGMSRRSFLQGSAATVAVSALGPAKFLELAKKPLGGTELLDPATNLALKGTLPVQGLTRQAMMSGPNVYSLPRGALPSKEAVGLSPDAPVVYGSINSKGEFTPGGTSHISAIHESPAEMTKVAQQWDANFKPTKGGQFLTAVGEDSKTPVGAIHYTGSEGSKSLNIKSLILDPKLPPEAQSEIAHDLVHELTGEFSGMDIGTVKVAGKTFDTSADNVGDILQQLGFDVHPETQAFHDAMSNIDAGEKQVVDLAHQQGVQPVVMPSQENPYFTTNLPSEGDIAAAETPTVKGATEIPPGAGVKDMSQALAAMRGGGGSAMNNAGLPISGPEFSTASETGIAKEAPAFIISDDDIKNAQTFLDKKSTDLPPSIAKLNLDTLGGSEDIDKLISGISSYTRDRVKQPLGYIRDTAYQLGVSPDDFLSGRVGKSLDPFEIDALGMTLRASAENLSRLADEAISGSSADSKLKWVKAWSVHRALQEYAEGARANASRSLNVWKQFGNTAGNKAEVLSSFLDGLSPTLTVDDLIQKTSTLGLEGITSAGGPAAMAARVGAIVRAASKATSRDSFLNVFYNIMLSNPATPVANIAGNGISALVHILDRFNAAAISKLRFASPTKASLAASGMSNDAVALGEGTALMYGFISSVKDAARLAWRGMKAGQQTFGGQVIMDAQKNLRIGTKEYRMASWKSAKDPIPPFNSYSDMLKLLLPTRWMSGPDDFWKWMNYRAELNALTYRNAIANGLGSRDAMSYMGKLIDYPSDAMDATAKNQGLVGTFNQSLDRWMAHIQRWLDGANIPLVALDLKGDPVVHELPVGRILVPFLRTTTDLLKWSYSHSPVALLVPSSRIRAEIAAGGASRDLAIGKMVTGSMLTAATADLFLGGIIDGAGPTDPVEFRTWRDAGHEPYTIRVGNHRYSYRRLSPVGDFIGMVADTVSAMQKLSDPDSSTAASSVVLSAAETFMNKSSFMTIGNMFEAIHDPETSGDLFINQLASSANPTLVKTVERAMDPTVRMHYDLLDSLQNGIPGASESGFPAIPGITKGTDPLPPEVDNWGRDVSKEGSWLPGVDPRYAQIVSPVNMKTVAPEPVDTWMWDHKLFKDKIPKTVEFSSGHGVTTRLELTPQQLHDYKKLAGNDLKDPVYHQGAKDYLNDLVSGTSKDTFTQQQFNRASPEMQKVIVSDIINKYRENAKKALVAKFPHSLGDVINKGLQDRARALQPELTP